MRLAIIPSDTNKFRDVSLLGCWIIDKCWINFVSDSPFHLREDEYSSQKPLDLFYYQTIRFCAAYFTLVVI